jgi:hypothetical protein
VLIEIQENRNGVSGNSRQAARGALRGTGKERKPVVALRAAKKGTVHVHGLFLVGLGKDPKEVEERGEPSILGAGSSCQ